MAEQPMIVVRGEAFREVPPELAVFSVSVTARGTDRETVVMRLTERAAELRGLLDGFGDAIEKRETSGFQIFPEFKRRGDKPVAYTGNAGTTVTVSDFDVLGEMIPRLALLTDASVNGPWWQLRPGSRAGADVRREAIADALDRAGEYAAAVSARIDRLVEISDEGTGGSGPGFRTFMAKEESAATIELDPQQQAVQASVIVRVTITDPDLKG